MFGVVVELGTPRIADPTAFVACRSDHICWTHLATFEWAVYEGLAPALHPPKHCANTLNCASHFLLNGWVHAGLASRTLLEHS